MDDRALVESLRSDDPKGPGLLFDRFHAVVFGLCFRMMGHRQDAEDVTQDSFLRALGAIRGFDIDRPLRPWLLGIAANRCRTALVHRTRRPSTAEAAEEPVDPRPGLTDPDGLAGELERAIGRLRPNYRLVFLLYHEQGLSYEEIGQATSRPIGTVKTWIHRARSTLAEDLSRRGVEVLKDGMTQAGDLFSMTCDDADRLWHEILDGRGQPLPGLEALIAEHGKSCTRCRETSAHYQVLSSALLALKSPPAPSPNLEKRFLAACETSHPKHLPARFRRSRWVIPAMAASILAVAWVSSRPIRPEAKPVRPQVQIHLALSDVTSATLDLARGVSAPAARIGLDVLHLDDEDDEATGEETIGEGVQRGGGNPRRDGPATIDGESDRCRNPSALRFGTVCLRVLAPSEYGSGSDAARTQGRWPLMRGSRSAPMNPLKIAVLSVLIVSIPSLALTQSAVVAQQLSQSHASDFLDWQAYDGAGWRAMTKGYYDTAEHEFQAAIKVANRLAPVEDRQFLARSYAGLASALQHQGRSAQAEPLARWALAVREAKLGPNSPSVATTLGILAEIEASLGQSARAEKSLRRALSIHDTLDQPDLYETSDLLDTLGRLLASQRRYAESESIFERVITLRQGLIGWAHPVTVESVLQLAEVLFHQGKDDQSLPLLTRALTGLEQNRGRTHRSLVSPLLMMADIHGRQSANAEAEAEFRRALAILDAANPQGDRETIGALKRYAAWLERAGACPRSTTSA